MRRGLAVITLLGLLIGANALSGFAQTGIPAPHRLTFDGRTEPIAWELSGILVARPGAVLRDGDRVRVANELWQIDPSSGAGRQLSADSTVPARRSTGPVGGATVSVVNVPTLAPELWLTPAGGSGAGLLLKGTREYFDLPVVSPDGARYAFTRTPTGSVTRGSSAIWAGRVSGGPPLLLITGASSPLWSPDGRLLTFEHDGDLYTADIAVTRQGWAVQDIAFAATVSSQPSSLTPPPSIRVYHTKLNYDFSQMHTCRNTSLPVGAVTTLPLEDYVRFVLPIEASPSDPPESLKAQAVASRTYAWACINHGGICTTSHPAYDITDWTGDQAMCELRADSRTDAAGAATAGQYLSSNGLVAAALYSANNSDPTRTNTSEFNNPGIFPYLRAVDDPVTFGNVRSGHGQGLSQVGSIRWAGNFGWDYIQILTHYYTGITVEGASNFGSLIAPWNNWWQTSNRIRIRGNASNGGAFDIRAVGQGLTSTLVASNPLLASLDVSGAPDQPPDGLVISGTLGTSQVTALTLGVDRLLPGGTLSAPLTTTVPTITLQLAGFDNGPSGFAGYGLSNHWIWEGEDKRTHGNALGAGSVVTDSDALNGQALYAPRGGSGVWYGPYTTALPFGHPYRAYFRLKTTGVLTTSEVAKIDVVSDQVNPIGLRHLYGTDFRNANTYQEFSVDFDYVSGPYVMSTTNPLEFRVDFPGAADLWLDRILIAAYPAPAPLTTSWVLSSSVPGSYIVIAKFSDNAGNVSPDVPQLVSLVPADRLFLPLLLR